MPAFATHETFSEEVLEELEDAEIKQIIQKHIGVFHLGSQGPDLFFYHPILLRGSKKWNLGSRMHEERSSAFFYYYLRHLSNNKNRYGLETGIAYLMGLLAHYTLDAELHPFVYGRVGFDPQDPASGVRVLPAHHRLEAVMDLKMLVAKRDKLPSDYAPAKKVAMKKRECHYVDHLMAAAVSDTFHQRVLPETVHHSYHNLKIVMRFLYCQKTYAHNPLKNLMVYDGLVDLEDAMNEQGQVWSNPWDSKQISRANAWELYDGALDTYQRYAAVVIPVLTQLLSCITMKGKGRPERRTLHDVAVRLENRSYHKG